MNISVCIIELPKNIHGVSTKELEKRTIYINENDPMLEKLKTYFRGIARIKFRHFESDVPLKVCNDEANAYAYGECTKMDIYKSVG